MKTISCDRLQLLLLTACLMAFVVRVGASTEDPSTSQSDETFDHSLITKENHYIWPEKGTIVIDSEKTNVTVWFGKLGTTSKVRTTFEYWTR